MSYARKRQNQLFQLSQRELKYRKYKIQSQISEKNLNQKRQKEIGTSGIFNQYIEQGNKEILPKLKIMKPIQERAQEYERALKRQLRNLSPISGKESQRLSKAKIHNKPLVYKVEQVQSEVVPQTFHRKRRSKSEVEKKQNKKIMVQQRSQKVVRKVNQKSTRNSKVVIWKKEAQLKKSLDKIDQMLKKIRSKFTRKNPLYNKSKYFRV